MKRVRLNTFSIIHAVLFPLSPQTNSLVLHQTFNLQPPASPWVTVIKKKATKPKGYAIQAEQQTNLVTLMFFDNRSKNLSPIPGSDINEMTNASLLFCKIQSTTLQKKMMLIQQK